MSHSPHPLKVLTPPAHSAEGGIGSNLDGYEAYEQERATGQLVLRSSAAPPAPEFCLAIESLIDSSDHRWIEAEHLGVVPLNAYRDELTTSHIRGRYSGDPTAPVIVSLQLSEPAHQNLENLLDSVLHLRAGELSQEGDARALEALIQAVSSEVRAIPAPASGDRSFETANAYWLQVSEVLNRSELFAPAQLADGTRPEPDQPGGQALVDVRLAINDPDQRWYSEHALSLELVELKSGTAKADRQSGMPEMFVCGTGREFELRDPVVLSHDYSLVVEHPGPDGTEDSAFELFQILALGITEANRWRLYAGEIDDVREEIFRSAVHDFRGLGYINSSAEYDDELKGEPDGPS